MDKDLANFIKNKHLEYKRFRPTPCPAFDNELIHFNKAGFNHLVRKGRFLRSSKEIIRRLNLLPEVPNIISSCKSFHTKRPNFWSLKAKRKGVRIVVVIRQLKGGVKHFFSVMDD